MELIVKRQTGVMLLEALVAILIFSIGILAIVGLQAVSIANQSNAKYRADGAYLAQQIIGTIWGDRANIATYAHNPTPAITAAAGATCTPNVAASANANVTAWTAKVANSLPGAAAANQQIIVNAAANNLVTVAVCWKAPQEVTWHNYVLSANIN